MAMWSSFNALRAFAFVGEKIARTMRGCQGVDVEIDGVRSRAPLGHRLEMPGCTLSHTAPT